MRATSKEFAAILNFFFCLIPLVVCAGDQTPDLHSTADRRTAVELRSSIQALSAAGDFAEALIHARELQDVLRSTVEPKSWEILDVERSVQTLTAILRLPTADQDRLAEAYALDAAIEQQYAQSQFDRSLLLARRQFEIMEQHLSTEHHHTAISRNSVAVLLEAKGEFEAAEREFRAALATIRRIYGDLHPSTALCLNNLANLMRARGQIATSVELHRKALDVRRATVGNDHSDTLQSMNNLSNVLLEVGDLPEAEALASDVLASRRRLHGTEHADVAIAVNNLAEILRRRGDFVRAEQLHREALTMRRRLLNADHHQIAISLNNLASLLARRGDHLQAELYLREALHIWRRVVGPQHPVVAAGLNNLAGLLKSNGRVQEAEALHREALRIRRKFFGECHPVVAESLNNLAVILQIRGNWSEAGLLYREAIIIWRETYGDENEFIAQATRSLAVLSWEQDKVAESLALCREAVEMQRRVLADAIDLATGLVTLSMIQEEMNDLRNAEQTLHEAMALLRSAPRYDVQNTAYILSAFAGFFARRGDYETALPVYEEVMQLIENHRWRVLGDESVRASRAGVLKLPTIAGGMAHALFSQGRLSEGLEVLERGRGRAFLDLLTRAELGVAGKESDSDSGMELKVARAEEDAVRRSLDRAVADTSILPQVDSAGASPELAAHQIDELRRRLGHAEARTLALLRTASPDAQPETCERIRSALHPHELMLVFSWGSRHVGLLTIPPKDAGSLGYVVLADGREAVHSLKRSVLRVRQQLAQPPGVDGGVALTSDLRALSERLIHDSVRGAIVTAESLVIIGDGPLVGMPFETLSLIGRESRSVTPPAEEVMLMGPRISYADSATVFVNRRAERARRSLHAPFRAVVVADPQFMREPSTRAVHSIGAVIDWNAHSDVVNSGGATMPSLSKLPGTRREAELISQTLRRAGGETVVLTGADAVLSRLESALPGCRYLHLATHGFSGSSDHPFNSKLALAPDGPAESQSFLTLEHMIRHWRGRLEDCDLVVLSACDSQRAIRQGDSTMALNWGFMYAGAPTVIASLWTVEDAPTALLMKRFYQNLLGDYEEPRGSCSAGQPMGKAEALREAKVWFRSHEHASTSVPAARGGFGTMPVTISPLAAGDYHDHPYYWAGVVLVGAPD